MGKFEERTEQKGDDMTNFVRNHYCIAICVYIKIYIILDALLVKHAGCAVMWPNAQPDGKEECQPSVTASVDGRKSR